MSENYYYVFQRWNKFVFTFLLLFLGFFSYTQVGIGIDDPKQSLHISGNLRIDGLNTTNNPINTEFRRVYATSDGDLVLLEKPAYHTVAIDTVRGFQEIAATNITFTVGQNSLVHVQAAIPITFIDIKNSPDKTNVYGAYFKVSSASVGTNINTNSIFGRTIDSYTSEKKINGENNIIGRWYTNPQGDIMLPSGTYTITLYAYSSNFEITVNPDLSSKMLITTTPLELN